jgi:type I restriction enzyme, S subunit
VPLHKLLTERKEPVHVTGSLGDWQPITIKFSGDVLPRDRAEVFKGAMFAAYPGDVVFSKIDARNGAVGLIPASMPKVVLTPEYPVMVPDLTKLRPAYLHYLLRAEHFRHDLQRQASGTSGRKRVTPEAFLSMTVPLPLLDEQDALVAVYEAALNKAAQKESEAEVIAKASHRAFEEALGMAPPPPLPSRPMFVARFKDVERWSHEGILHAKCSPQGHESKWPMLSLGEVLIEVRHGCSLSPARAPTTLRVLKISSVTKGVLDLTQFKHLEDSTAVRATYSLCAGDILMCRTNGTIQYVGMSALVSEDVADTVFPDKVIRVRADKSRVVPAFLWRLLQLPAVRRQIEGAARTAVGNFAIGGHDIKALTVPLPPPDVQTQLAQALNDARADVSATREKACALREAAWAAFESGLFKPQKQSTEGASP